MPLKARSGWLSLASSSCSRQRPSTVMPHRPAGQQARLFDHGSLTSRRSQSSFIAGAQVSTKTRSSISPSLVRAAPTSPTHLLAQSRGLSSTPLRTFPSRDPLQAEREAGTVAGNREARARAEALQRQTEVERQRGASDGGQQTPPSPPPPNYGKGLGGAKRAWKDTPIKWYPIPIFLGAIVLVGVQARRNYLADREGSRGKIVDENGTIVTMSGPWTVYVLGALPLNAISRLWGWANNLTLPVWFRPTGFKFYSWIFGCNLDEMKDPDLTHYGSLGEFFYRELKDGARQIDEEAPLVSPADGTVLHFGTIKGRQVEQVKGLTYSLDALLGLSGSPQGIEQARSDEGAAGGPHMDDKEFAAINGIDYSLDRLLGNENTKRSRYRFISWSWWKSWVVKPGRRKRVQEDNVTGIPASTDPADANKTATKPDPNQTSPSSGQPAKSAASASSAPPTSSATSDDDEDSEPEEAGMETPDSPEILSRYASVAYEMGSGALPPILQRHSGGREGIPEGDNLYFAVVYLAPGDYHHFHSPTNWVAERRRHFRGELYSVSPYIASRLSNLFILNERVALLGRWRYGFFSMIPVGATNVGSIRINFDSELRTNQREQRRLAGTFTEASYANASRLLGGQPLTKGEEMGGFLLGSTVILVFSAPAGFNFDVKAGEKVKMGQKLGDFGGGEKGMSEKERREHSKRRKWFFF